MGGPELIRKMIELPMDGYEFISLYRQNKDVIQAKIDSKERYEMYASIFNIPKDADGQNAEMLLRSMALLHFEDSKSLEEVVYSISINPILKRVTLAFRGSVTQKTLLKTPRHSLRPSQTQSRFWTKASTWWTLSLCR